MNDPTLNPETDESQPQRALLQQIVDQLARSLGEPEGEPQPLEGGITNRNFRARLGGRDYVIRVPGKDTSLLEIDREGERIANERAARPGSRHGSRRRSPTRNASSPSSSWGRGWSPSSCASRRR